MDFPKFADIEDIRFRYEVMGESLESICSSSKIYIRDLEAYIAREGWLRPSSVPDTDDTVAEFYKKGRWYLTKLNTRRAVLLAKRLNSIEDSIIGSVEDVVSAIDPGAPGSASDLDKLTKVIASISNRTSLIRESVETAGFYDKKLDRVAANPLADLIAQLDGRGRVLPSADELQDDDE
jgi:hypothetical protein